MIRNARAAITVAVAALAMLTVGVGTGAAKPPASFFGVVPQTSLGSKDFERMSSGKVGTLRTILTWAAVDKAVGADDNDWSSFDPLVLEAARNGIEMQPFIFGTPNLVAQGPRRRQLHVVEVRPLRAEVGRRAGRLVKSFVGEAVDRYGPNGEFWTLHPEVPKDPIHVWQILNEQNSKSFFAAEAGPEALREACSRPPTRRSTSATRRLTSCSAGWPELAGSHKAILGSEYLAKLYKVKGVKDTFDAVAPHPYGATLGKVTSQIDLYRQVMKKAHDSGASMYVTEVGAGSKKGGSSLNRGKKGQATLLRDIYKYFAKQRNKLHVEAGGLVQLAGLADEHLLVVLELGPADRPAARRSRPTRSSRSSPAAAPPSASVSRCRRACGGPRSRCGSVEADRDPLRRLGLERRRGIALDRVDPLRVADRSSSAPNSATAVGSRISSASASIWTPRSSVYSVPASISSVARGSRSRLRTFCDFAKVQTQISPSRTREPHRHRVRPAARADAS